MAEPTPKNDNLHGEEDSKPRFGDENYSWRYDDADPYSNATSSPKSDGIPSNNTSDGSTRVGKKSGWGGGKSLNQNRTGSSSSRAANRSELGEQESQAEDSSESTAANEEKALLDRGGSLYKTEQAGRLGRIRGRLSKFSRRKIATIAVTGIIGGGGIFGASFLQGPFQLVHFSQQLQTFFSSRQDEDNSRIGKIGRYIYHTKRGGGAQNLRLGVLGNKYADTIEKKLNQSGIETAYRDKTGYRTGYFIDPDEIPNTELDKYKRLDPKGNIDIDATQKAIKTGLEGELGYPLSVESDGRLYLDADKIDGNFKKGTNLTKTIIKASGYEGRSTGIAARTMGKRAGISWHPIKKADRKLNITIEDAYNNWKDKTKERITGQKGERGTASAKEDDDPNKSEQQKQAEKQASQGEADNANELKDQSEKAYGDKSKISALQQSTGAKLAAGAAGGIGVACMIKSIDDKADDVKDKEVIAPAMKIAGDNISVGDQDRSGDDTDMTQSGFFARQLYGKDSSGNKTSWSNSQAIKARNGKAGGDTPLATLTSIPKGSPFAFIQAPAVKTVLDPACSTGGMIATTIIGVATGGLISTASGIIAGSLAGPLVMDQLVDWISGTPLNPLPVGADLGNTASFGAKLMARSQGASGGGRELSDADVAEYKQIDEENSRQEFNSKSLAYRIFSPNDHRTLTASVIDSNAISPDGVASFVSNPLKTFGSLFSNTGNFFSPKAAAAADDPTNVIKDIGFSPKELENAKVNNPFKNAEDVVKMLPQHPEYVDLAKKCFGVDVDSSTGDITSLNASTPTFKDGQSGECNDPSEDFLQFRMYIKDTQVMTSLACQEGDDDSCADIGLTEKQAQSDDDEDSSSETAGKEIDMAHLKDPSDKVDCAENTKDAGVIDGYTGGNKVRIRLCEIPNLPQSQGFGSKNGHATVNSRVSGAVYAMMEAAKKDGVNMSASSSSRTMADQRSLCPCDGVTKARPGFSNHQLGVAIDFGGNGTLMDKSNPMWKWLNKNADKFDYKPYTREDWHWSPFGS